jgi:hypothetical protein
MGWVTMSGIEKALAGDPFSIDLTQCLLAAQAVESFTPGGADNPWASAPSDSQLVFKLFFVAICHQINWDFLQRRMYKFFFAEDFREMIERAQAASAKAVEEMLAGYHRPERIRSSERAKYLRTTSEAISEYFFRDPRKLVASNTVFGEGGLLELIRKIPAYGEDPLGKKANAFAQELAREGIVKFADSDRIPPAIDYHLIRLYLRTGRVVANNTSIFRVLSTGSTHRMRLVNLLRQAVSEALSQTAAYARMPPHVLNYLEWQIGRNRCERQFMNCDGSWPAELFDGSVIAMSAQCPMRDSCTAYHTPEWKKMLEPALKKAFY